MSLRIVVCLLSIACIAPFGFAEDEHSEISFFIGGLTGDSFTFVPPGLFTEVTAVLDDDLIGGFRYAYYFNPHVAGEFGIGFSPATIFTRGSVSGGTNVSSAVSVDTYLLHANILIPVIRGTVEPFVTAGVGLVHFSLDSASLGFLTPSETDFAWNAGGGVKIHATEDVSARFDARVYQMNPEFAEKETATFGEFSGGVSILFDF